jgi:hypothetical protein
MLLIATVRGTGLIVVVACAVMTVGCNPGVSRTKGQVVTVRKVGDETEVCVSGARDAGSSYRTNTDRIRECQRGIIKGRQPKEGECVTLRLQGESSELHVSASAC